MRRYTKALLLLLAALFYAGTASAVSISVIETSAGTGGDGSYYPSDIVTVDIVIDTEGILIYGFTTMIEFDDSALSAVSAVNNPVTGIDPGYYSPYIYPNSYYPSAHAGWYLGGVSWAGVNGVLNVATLVFHVMDVPNSTAASIVPTFDDAGATALFVLAPGGTQLENADVTRSALTIHVPEPTTTMLMGLGLFGILYAGRRR